jgi:hypothetical protein
MKNLNSSSNFYRTEREGRFLFLETKETLNNLEITPLDIKTNSKLEQLELRTENNLPTPKETSSEEKKEVAQKTPQEELKEMIQGGAVEYVKRDPDFQQDIINHKYENPEELSLAIRDYIEKKPTGFTDYLKKYTIPSDPGNMGKLAAAGFALGTFGTNKGGLDAIKNGLKYGAITAALTSPLVTNVLADGLKFAGKGIFWVGDNAITAMTEFIYHPTDFLNKIKAGDNPLENKQLGKNLSISQNPVFLLENGVKFSPKLTNLIKFTRDYDPNKSKTISLNQGENPAINVATAAEFINKTNDIALSPEELKKLQNKWYERKNIPENIRRQIIANTLRNHINEFFGKKGKGADLEAMFKLEMTKNQKQLKLKDLKNLIGVGQNLNNLDEKMTNGVREFLKQPLRGGLILYILMFFLTKGVMFGSSLFHKGAEKVKNRPGESLKNALVFIPDKLWSAAKWTVGMSDKAIWRSNVKSMGKSLKTGGWDSDQEDAWDKLSAEDKDKVAEKLSKIIEKRKKDLKDKKDEIKKNAKEQKGAFWKFRKNSKISKEAKEDIKKLEKELEVSAETSTKSLDKETWNGLFKGIDGGEKFHKK